MGLIGSKGKKEETLLPPALFQEEKRKSTWAGFPMHPVKMLALTLLCAGGKGFSRTALRGGQGDSDVVPSRACNGRWRIEQLASRETADLAEADLCAAQSMLLQELKTGDDCPICLEPQPPHARDSAVFPECGHTICVGCAAKWARTSSTLRDSESGVPSPCEPRHGMPCPLCNRICSTVFIQLQHDGRYLAEGEWRRVNIADLVKAFGQTEAAREDSGWGLLANSSASLSPESLLYGTIRDDDDDAAAAAARLLHIQVMRHPSAKK